MNHSDFAALALLKARLFLGNSEPLHVPLAPTLNDNLTGATLLELEPDLAKEAGYHTR